MSDSGTRRYNNGRSVVGAENLEKKMFFFLLYLYSLTLGHSVVNEYKSNTGME